MGNKSRVSAKDVMDILGAGRSSQKRRDEPCGVGVLVAADAPRATVEAVRDALMPELPTSQVAVAPLGESPATSWDAAVVLAGADIDAADAAARSCAAVGVPACVVVETAVEEREGEGDVDYVAGATPQAVVDALAAWLVDACPKKATALAANFPFCRHAHVASLVRSCALENAAVGAIDLIPRADLPVMAVSQAKLALDIEAAHGGGSAAESGVDVALVMGLSLAWRALARSASHAVPGLSWLVKGLVGAGGTWATGTLVELRAQGDVDLAGMAATAAQAVAGAVSGAAEAVRGAGFDASEAASRLRALQPPLPARPAAGAAGDYLTLG